MFAALELQPPTHHGLKKYISALLPRPAPQIVQQEINGAYFAVIRAPLRHGAPNWSAVEHAAGRYANHMLLPDGITPPPESSIQALDSPKFALQVLCCTACELINRTRIPMYRRIVGLFDPQAEYTGLLFPLLHHYTTVQVVTDRFDLYEKAANQMMQRLGAPVLLGNGNSSFEECVLILAPGILLADQCSFPRPVLSTMPLPFPGADNFSALETEPDKQIAALCPAGISPHRFAAALYDFCSVNTGNYVAEHLTLNGRQITLDDAVTYLLHSVMQGDIEQKYFLQKTI